MAGDARLAALVKENQRLRELVGGCVGHGRDGAFCRSRARAARVLLCRGCLPGGTLCAHPSAAPPLPALQLADHASAGASKSGYLCKYREHATSSLWAPTWENRFVIVKGGSLTYYRTEQDVQFPPRGQIELEVGGWPWSWPGGGGLDVAGGLGLGVGGCGWLPPTAHTSRR